MIGASPGPARLVAPAERALTLSAACARYGGLCCSVYYSLCGATAGRSGSVHAGEPPRGGAGTEGGREWGVLVAGQASDV